MNAVARQFEVKPAIREAVGLLVGIVGPSSCGKTFSGLRLGTGIQQITGGDFDVIDTENGRALYYADKFKFNHLRFGAPFGPLDYLEAIRYCAGRGAKTIMVDSMSHEHDGPGGVLEIHEQELQRLGGGDPAKMERIKLLAWSRPKQMRKRLINELLQLNVNLICTFRAKEKLKPQKGKEPLELGWQPICGDEFMYEMVLQMLLKPGSEGMPAWSSELEGERAIMKMPNQFRNLFEQPKQIDEELGKRLAEWAAGGKPPADTIEKLLADFAACATSAQFAALELRRGNFWTKSTSVESKASLSAASKAAKARVEAKA